MYIESGDLRNAAEKLLDIEQNVKTLALNIQNCAQDISSGYRDSAGTLYVQRLEALDADFQKIIAMIDEHGQELSQTSTEVETLLNDAEGKARALPTENIC